MKNQLLISYLPWTKVFRLEICVLTSWNVLLIFFLNQGCYCIGEANFSDHGANRLGASEHSNPPLLDGLTELLPPIVCVTQSNCCQCP